MYTYDQILDLYIAQEKMSLIKVSSSIKMGLKALWEKIVQLAESCIIR